MRLENMALDNGFGLSGALCFAVGFQVLTVRIKQGAQGVALLALFLVLCGLYGDFGSGFDFFVFAFLLSRVYSLVK